MHKSWLNQLILALTLVGRSSFICSAAEDEANAVHVTPDGDIDVTSLSASWLRPSDLPDWPLFSSYESNATVSLPGLSAPITVAEGSVVHAGTIGSSSSFAVLPSIASRDEVASILTMLKGAIDDGIDFDTEPDSVDGMASHEIFIDNDSLRAAREQPDASDESKGDGSSLPDQAPPGHKLDSSRVHLAKREPLRAELQKLTAPILERIVAYLRHRYDERSLTACYSLIRRYRAGERQSHEPHYDKHAYASAIVSLSDYGVEYRGGFYVSTGRGAGRHVLPLNAGDAAVHRSDLLHGVSVKDDGGERWSWILWFLDSDQCADTNQKEWHKACAKEGGAVCAELYANSQGSMEEMIQWQERAADGGLGSSMVKLARAYEKALPSPFELDLNKAEELYRRAIASTNEPDAHYGLARLLLSGVATPKNASPSPWDLMNEVVGHLEEAAKARHVYSMFNLGIAHTYGFAKSQLPNNHPNYELAVEWFKACGLPEGYMAASLYYGAMNEAKLAKEMEARAKRLGFGEVWRTFARQQTGSGGAGGVDLNLPWPTAPDGRTVPKW